MSSKTILISLILLTCFCSLSFADTIYLKNGKVINGQIVNETTYYITVVEGNKMVDYFDDEVERIEKSEQALNLNENPQETPQLDLPPQTSNSKRALVMQLMEANGTRKDIDARIKTLLTEVGSVQREQLKEVFKLEEVLNSLVPVYDKYYTQDELQQIVDFHRSPVGRKVYEVTPDLINDALLTIVGYFKEKFEAANK